MVEVAVFGSGRIGLGTALILRELGVDSVLVDRDCGRLERIRRELGFETLCIDIVNSGLNTLREGIKGLGAEAAAIALPGSVGFEGLRKAVLLGFKWVVDVSFMREDPLVLNDKALSKGVTVFVDAGLAPGLSNLLVSKAYRALGLRVRDALIYVGGLSRDPKCPLGLAAAWNVRDLLDEYVRPARILMNGEVRLVNPLSMCGTIQVPGEGVFEYFVSDGLRTMIKTLKPPANLMAEYTLRYPGHLSIMKTLKNLGFLREDDVIIGKALIKPIDLSAKVLEEALSKCVEDKVVMYVKVSGVNEGLIEYVVRREYDSSRDLTAMTLTTSGTQACLMKSLLDSSVRPDPGVHGLEYLGINGFDEPVLKCLSTLNVSPEPVRR